VKECQNRAGIDNRCEKTASTMVASVLGYKTGRPSGVKSPTLAREIHRLADGEGREHSEPRHAD
jgi:hypothetical protein